MLKRYVCYFPNGTIIHVKLDYPAPNSLTELQGVTRRGKLRNWDTQAQKAESHCLPSHSLCKLQTPKVSHASVWEVHWECKICSLRNYRRSMTFWTSWSASISKGISNTTKCPCWGNWSLTIPDHLTCLISRSVWTTFPGTGGDLWGDLCRSWAQWSWWVPSNLAYSMIFSLTHTQHLHQIWRFSLWLLVAQSPEMCKYFFPYVHSKILTELRGKNQKSQPSVVGNAQTSDEEGNHRKQLG